MLDRDLAALYQVRAIALRQQVKRNRERFPVDFMFQITEKEADILVSQSVIPSLKHLGGWLPYVFTQEGVAMLSSVLQSPRAVAVNIEIMRTFVRIREKTAGYHELAGRLDRLESRCEVRFGIVFQTIRRLIDSSPRPSPRVGFKPEPG